MFNSRNADDQCNDLDDDPSIINASELTKGRAKWATDKLPTTTGTDITVEAFTTTTTSIGTNNSTKTIIDPPDPAVGRLDYLNVIGMLIGLCGFYSYGWLVITSISSGDGSGYGHLTL